MELKASNYASTICNFFKLQVLFKSQHLRLIRLLQHILKLKIPAKIIISWYIIQGSTFYTAVLTILKT